MSVLLEYNVIPQFSGIDGKKIFPPSKPPKAVFKIKNFSSLVVNGEKLVKKPTFKVPMEMKMAFKPDELVDKEGVDVKTISRKKMAQLKPLKLYKSPQKPRNIFQTIIVKPPHSNDNYLRQLPSILRSNNRKFINLCDLIRCLSFKK